MLNSATGVPPIRAVLCAGALLLGALLADGGDAVAKPKKIVKGGTCSCDCRSDERVETVPGKPSRYRETISFAVSSDGQCSASNGGGCHFKRNGVTVLGTVHGCNYRDNADAANKNDIAPSDPEPNGPLQPFSRPGSIFSP